MASTGSSAMSQTEYITVLPMENLMSLVLKPSLTVILPRNKNPLLSWDTAQRSTALEISARTFS